MMFLYVFLLATSSPSLELQNQKSVYFQFIFSLYLF